MKLTITHKSLGLTLKELIFLLFLICAAGFSTILQFVSLFLFSFVFLFVGRKIKFIGRWFFFISLIVISLAQLLLFWKTDYSFNYIVNSGLIAFMWFLALQGSNIVINNVFEIDAQKIERILKIFFKINLFLAILQILYLCIELKTLFPFSNMSAGDCVKGLFRNSSVNMVVMYFYSLFFFSKRDYKYFTIAVIVMILTFYMSGLLLFVSVFFMYSFLNFSFKNKLKVIGGLALVFLMFIYFSPKNVKYVQHILNDKLSSKTDPPRKLVSFNQTFDNWVSDPVNFVFGSGGGKFSSRTAFITGGEYVKWFPQNLTYISNDFQINHFQLWNYKILSIPYKDGTSNQPFSFYNKIIGEYGLIGVILFLFYLYIPIKYFKHLTYGKLIFLSIFAYFLLDYWFEYFSVIIFFELFLFLDISNYLKKPLHK
jgi:hypothetical protein